MDELPLLATDPDLPVMKELLAKIEGEGTYYEMLDRQADPEAPLLDRLKRLGMIRWCPYPEEFYVILPPGLALLHDE